MRMPQVVWFCAAETCDDQKQWTHSFVTKCPTCGNTDDVTRAIKIGEAK